MSERPELSDYLEGVNYDKILKVYRKGFDNGFDTNLGMNFSELFKIAKGYITVLTGVPGHGKSEFMDQITVNMAEKYKWRTMYYSPENFPIEQHHLKLIEKYTKQQFFGGGRMSEQTVKSAFAWVNVYFAFIDPQENENIGLDGILEMVETEHRENGLDMFVLDPWNEVEPDMKKNENDHQWIGRCIKKLRLFARKLDIALFVIAHPKKMETNSKGKSQVPSPYDIAGSSNWYNKADNIITVFRDDDARNVRVMVQKVKLRQYGKIGLSTFEWFGGRGGTYKPTKNE